MQDNISRSAAHKIKMMMRAEGPLGLHGAVPGGRVQSTCRQYGPDPQSPSTSPVQVHQLCSADSNVGHVSRYVLGVYWLHDDPELVFHHRHCLLGKATISTSHGMSWHCSCIAMANVIVGMRSSGIVMA